MTDTQLPGPISYLIVEFPNEPTGEALAELVELVDRGLINILDLAFVTRGEDGSVVAIDVSDIDGDGTLDLTIFEGVSSGLLDASDLADSAPAIAPGKSAAILIFENAWAAKFTAALRRNDVELVAAGYIPLADIVASLEAAEAAG